MKKHITGRLTQLGRMGASLGIKTLSSGIGGALLRKDKALLALHEHTAKKLLETLGEMKGLPMKIGQVLSYMDGVLPPEVQPIYRETLSKLQVKVSPHPWDVMGPFLERELGKPLESVFSFLEKEPIAAASIGQVYFARVLDGEEVAIKVQYPDIKSALENDLKVVGGIVATLSQIVPNIDVEQMSHDVVARFKDESDYLIEASNQKTFAELWKNDKRIIIPRVFDELSSSRVLVTEFIRGENFHTVASSQDVDLKSEIGETLFWFVMHSLFTHGLFNADPHPGNFLFPNTNQVVFLDFGCVQKFSGATRQALCEVRNGVLAGVRGKLLWELLCKNLGFEPNQPEAMQKLIEEYLLFSFEPMLAKQPFRYSAQYTSQLSELTFQSKKYLLKNIFRSGWKEPKQEGLVLLNRILFGLNSLLASLEAKQDWKTLIRKA